MIYIALSGRPEPVSRYIDALHFAIDGNFHFNQKAPRSDPNDFPLTGGGSYFVNGGDFKKFIVKAPPPPKEVSHISTKGWVPYRMTYVAVNLQQLRSHRLRKIPGQYYWHRRFALSPHDRPAWRYHRPSRSGKVGKTSSIKCSADTHGLTQVPIC